MATMIQTQQQPELSAWAQLMQKHPNIDLVLQAIGDLLSYFANGQFLVDAWRWAVLTAGNVSEAALMFAALYITAASVEPDAINAIPYGIPSMLSAGSMFALTLLPEVIVYHAIAVSYDHWRNTFTDAEHRAAHCTWAILYSLPTLTFLAMTIYTLCSFVSIGHTFAAPSWVLTGRVLAGWSYGVVGLIHAAINRRSSVKSESAASLNVVANVPAAQPIATLNQAHISEAPAEPQTEQIAELLSSEDQADSLPQPVPTDEPITEPEIEAIAEVPGNDDGTAATEISSAMTSAVVPQINITNRRKPLSTVEVAAVLGCTERYARDLRNGNKLERDDDDGKLVKAASVRAYLKNKGTQPTQKSEVAQ